MYPGSSHVGSSHDKGSGNSKITYDEFRSYFSNIYNTVASEIKGFQRETTFEQLEILGDNFYQRYFQQEFSDRKELPLRSLYAIVDDLGFSVKAEGDQRGPSGARVKGIAKKEAQEIRINLNYFSELGYFSVEKGRFTLAHEISHVLFWLMCDESIPQLPQIGLFVNYFNEVTSGTEKRLDGPRAEAGSGSGESGRQGDGTGDNPGGHHENSASFIINKRNFEEWYEQVTRGKGKRLSLMISAYKGLKRYSVREVLVNYLAGCIVMPRSLVLRELEKHGFDIVHLAEYFGVTLQTAAHRLTELSKKVPMHFQIITESGKVQKSFSSRDYHFMPAHTTTVCRMASSRRLLDILNREKKEGEQSPEIQRIACNNGEKVVRLSQFSALRDGKYQKRVFCQSFKIRRHGGDKQARDFVLTIGCEAKHAHLFPDSDDVRKAKSVDACFQAFDGQPCPVPDCPSNR